MSALLREFLRHLSRVRAEKIELCQPVAAARPASGLGWIHEIKHDGYRMIARRDGAGVRLLTRNGHDWSGRYPLIMSAVDALRCRSVVIDGEAVSCNDDGLAEYKRLRKRVNDASVFLYAFDLIELDGKDLRREPTENRKAALAKLLRSGKPGIRLVEHLEFDDGAMIFQHACKLGCEGLVSQRLGSRYRAGASRDWIKVKNPAAPAFKRELEEDWSKDRRRVVTANDES
jgi:bifunctional non-homologous end joining protein LigD